MKTLVTYIDEDTNEEKTREEEITDVIDIACGTQYTLVLKSDGTVWAAGFNNYGQCRKWKHRKSSLSNAS